MSTLSKNPAELALRLASRLCHDFAGTLGGILSGLELLDDPDSPVPRAEAIALVEQGARALSVQLSFARLAFGAGEEPVAAEQLEGVARELFAELRPDLEWMVVTDVLPASVARTLLNFAQLAAGALGAAGAVRCKAGQANGQWMLDVVAVGARARLFPEVAAGLGGEGRGEGLSGRWVQGALVYEIVRAVGGVVNVHAEDGAVHFSAFLPIQD